MWLVVLGHFRQGDIPRLLQLHRPQQAKQRLGRGGEEDRKGPGSGRAPSFLVSFLGMERKNASFLRSVKSLEEKQLMFTVRSAKIAIISFVQLFDVKRNMFIREQEVGKRMI